MSLGTWITVARAAELMGLSRHAALKRLRALDEDSGGQLLRRISSTGKGGKFEVSMGYLRGLLDREPEKQDVIVARLGTVEERLSALREVSLSYRRRTEKRIKALEARLAACSSCETCRTGSHG